MRDDQRIWPWVIKAALIVVWWRKELIYERDYREQQSASDKSVQKELEIIGAVNESVQRVTHSNQDSIWELIQIQKAQMSCNAKDRIDTHTNTVWSI